MKSVNKIFIIPTDLFLNFNILYELSFIVLSEMLIVILHQKNTIYDGTLHKSYIYILFVINILNLLFK